MHIKIFEDESPVSRKTKVHKMAPLENNDFTEREFYSSSDSLRHRRMFGRKDFVVILVLTFCLFHVQPVHTCGEDPLRKIYNFAKLTGQVPEAVLSNIREQDRQRYWSILQGHKLYDDCVVRVETGSFKRSGEKALTEKQEIAKFLRSHILKPSNGINPQELKRRPFYFFPSVSRRAGNSLRESRDSSKSYPRSGPTSTISNFKTIPWEIRITGSYPLQHQGALLKLFANRK